MKTVLITFFDIKGIVHFEFIPQGQTVGQAYYMEILELLLETELLPSDWILHHNKAPALPLSLKQFLAKKWITEMEHPFHSPDMSLNNFWLFSEVRSTSLKGS